MPPFRVAVIGCGGVGRRRAAIAASHPRSRLVVAVDLDAARAKEAVGGTGAEVTTEWRSVVERPDIDVVVVATLHDSLAPISLAALRGGKHVLCEKPMGTTVSAAEEIVAATRTTGRHLKVGFNHRHHPAIREAHALAASGAIGRLLLARCRYGHGGRSGYEREWRMDPSRSGGGELLDQGIHAIDLFRWFLGDFVEVSGMVASLSWAAPVEDNAFALLRTADGQVASLHASWTQWKNLFSLEVSGELGTLVVEGLGGSYGVERLTVHRRATSGAPGESSTEFPGLDHSWESEWDELVTALDNGVVPAASADDGLAALRVVNAVYESSKTRRTLVFGQ